MEHPTKLGTMVVNRRGKASVTDYEVIEDMGLYSLVQFRIHTGRTHQIRVHMQALGHPIVCDELYGDARPVLLSGFKRNFKLSKDAEAERPILSRLALHSHLLHFQDAGGEFHHARGAAAKGHAGADSAAEEMETVAQTTSLPHPGKCRRMYFKQFYLAKHTPWTL
ncbi:pseudouridine synthase [Puia sp. P3]|uniref:pseudouridine synthase n=1 Tax=Puia sp. P3 TaxID=3423952 RepID=UPI003D66B9D3